MEVKHSWNTRTENRMPILDSEHQETYDLIPHMTYSHCIIFRPPEVIDIWRSNTFRIIYGQKGASEWNQNTKKNPMIWFLTWPTFIGFIFWPEVKIRKKGFNEIFSEKLLIWFFFGGKYSLGICNMKYIDRLGLHFFIPIPAVNPRIFC